MKAKEFERSFVDHDPFYHEVDFMPTRIQAPKRQSSLFAKQTNFLPDSILGPIPPVLMIPASVALTFDKLDLRRITNRLIASGLPHHGPTDKVKQRIYTAYPQK